MSQRQGIAAAGNWIIDHVKMIESFPAEEHLVVIKNETRGTGGAPYNVLVGLAVLDPKLPLEAIGVVGDDENGAFILDHLRQLRIDSRGMRTTKDAPTSYTDVMTVEPTGRRTFFHNYGANALLCTEHFDLPSIRSRIFHLGYLMLLNALDAPDPNDPTRTCAAALLEQAQAAGLKTSVDIVSDLGPRLQQVVAPALPFTDYLVANELETGAAVGIQLRTPGGALIQEKLETVAVRLFDMGVRELVVIHAPEGGFWKKRGESPVFKPSLKVPQSFIKGTAGAGDAFCGGILYGLHEGWDADQCLTLAAANAAQSLSDPTTTGGLKSLSEVMKLVEQFGFRDE